MLSLDDLKQAYSYSPETGVFTHLKTRANHKAGQSAGTKDPEGYIQISVKNRIYRAHRAAWLYMTGEWPAQEIDHKNGVRSDNAWSNLRLSTGQQNKQNRHRAARNSTTGLMGVSTDLSGPYYRAKITVNGKSIYLGSFATPEQAHEAYLAAKREYHPTSTLAYG